MTALAYATPSEDLAQARRAFREGQFEAGLNHAINVPDVSFHSYASVAMGFEPLEKLL